VLQAAHGVFRIGSTSYVAGGKFNLSTADWFDDNYTPAWTTDEFLAQLEAQGLA
jgi:hypothetical protein